MNFKLNSIITHKGKIEIHYVITQINKHNIVINTLIYPYKKQPFVSNYQRSIDTKDLILFILIGHFIG